MATINKKQLVQKLARGSEKNFYTFDLFLDVVIDTIIDELKKGNVIKLRGLGSLYVKKKVLATGNG